MLAVIQQEPVREYFDKHSMVIGAHGAPYGTGINRVLNRKTIVHR